MLEIRSTITGKKDTFGYFDGLVSKLDPADDKVYVYLQKPAFMFTLKPALSDSFMDPLHCLLWLPTINAEQGSSPVNLLTAV